jgi:hypothetical protein
MQKDIGLDLNLYVIHVLSFHYLLLLNVFLDPPAVSYDLKNNGINND